MVPRRYWVVSPGLLSSIFWLFIPYEMCQGLVVLAHKVSEVKKYQKTKIYKIIFIFLDILSQIWYNISILMTVWELAQ